MLIRIGMMMLLLGLVMGDSENLTVPLTLIGLGLLTAYIGNRLEVYRDDR